MAVVMPDWLRAADRPSEDETAIRAVHRAYLAAYCKADFAAIREHVVGEPVDLGYLQARLAALSSAIELVRAEYEFIRRRPPPADLLPQVPDPAQHEAAYRVTVDGDRATISGVREVAVRANGKWKIEAPHGTPRAIREEELDARVNLEVAPEVRAGKLTTREQVSDTVRERRARYAASQPTSRPQRP